MPRAAVAILLVLTFALGGCPPPQYDPTMATRPYPERLRLEEVTRDDGSVVRVPRVVDPVIIRPTNHFDLPLLIEHDFRYGFRFKFTPRRPTGSRYRKGLPGLYCMATHAANPGFVERCARI